MEKLPEHRRAQERDRQKSGVMEITNERMRGVAIEGKRGREGEGEREGEREGECKAEGEK